MSDDSGDAPDLGAAPPARMLAEVRTLLDEVREALLDTASGEVVGALWEEFRSVRASLDELAGAAAAIEQLARLQTDMSELTAAVQDLVARSEGGEGPGPDSGSDDVLRSVATDVAALRSELSEGLVVEPSDALAGTVDQLRADLAGLHDRMQAVTELRSAVDELRASNERSGSDDDLRSMRTGIEDIIARLDEGLELADDIAPPAADAGPELADQVATLRDHVTAEFDSLRQLIDTMASAPDRDADAAPEGDEFARIDPDIIDLLREEIRAGGGVSDDVVDALRKELIALRRRIKLRAEGELFSTQQLDHIADAVARRLAE